MLDKSVIKNLQKLCRIKCSPQEEENLLKDLSRILEYVAQLKEIDTEGIDLKSQKEEEKLPLREDVIESPIPRDLFLANAPDKIGGMIRTPPILNDHV